MTTSPRRALLVGLALLLASLLLALAAAGMRGPLNPACAGVRALDPGCGAAASRALMLAAIAPAIAGAVLVALHLARQDPPRTASLAWGSQGLLAARGAHEVVVIVDVLSFGTALDVALARGARVWPAAWGDGEALAEREDALLARPRGEGEPSLCPASLERLPRGARLVLPSPNGAALSLLAGERRVFAASLRNATAVGRAAARAGERILVVAAGERTPDGGWREAEEDLLGAGAVLRALAADLDAPAQDAVRRFEEARGSLREALEATPTAAELRAMGHPEDVEMAARLDASATVPTLREGAYEDDRRA